MKFTSNALRNVTFCGHGSTGKTTLVENILFATGAIPQAHTVESGRTVSDFTPEEIERGASMHTTLSHVDWQNVKINLFDTPGLSDFVGEVVSSFRAAESAIMVVDAVKGVQIETIKLWRRLNKRRMPRMVFVNKMDDARADFFKVLKELENFDMPCIPITLPIGSANDYRGVIGLMKMTAFLPGEKGEREEEIPSELAKLADTYHFKMIEMAAEGDDAMTEKYFDQGTLSLQDAFFGLQEGLAENKFIPVFCGSGQRNSGIATLLNFIAKDSPSPSRILEPLANDQKPQVITPEGEFSGIVFKTSLDRFSGKMSFLKVITGTLTGGLDTYNVREGKKVHISRLFVGMGKEIKEVDRLSAGDLGIMTKGEHLQTNDTLCSPHDLREYLPLQLPHPVYSLAIEAENQRDDDKLSEQLHRVAEEDHTFMIRYNGETQETVISGMGELHIKTILRKIEKESKISLTTRIPRVPYRETITRDTTAEYTHKKQTGGHGQFGRVSIRAFPLERDKKFSFANVTKGGVISKGYMPGIEKGLREAMKEGHLAGCPMVNVGVEVFDGKEHSVDSSEMSFMLAAKYALKEAFERAKPVLLEPIMDLVIYVEESHLGDILSDLASRRGAVQGQESPGSGIQAVRAKIPQGEIRNYAVELRSLTSGTGTFEVEFSHYAVVQGKILQEKIIKEMRHTAS